MKSDVLVIGAELDGLVATLRLAEQGHHVRLLASGAGALHYASGGIHLLGYAPGSAGPILTDPLAAIDHLGAGHPYRLIGAERVRRALDWFLLDGPAEAPAYHRSATNALAVTPAGLEMPAYAWPLGQATFDDLQGKKVAIVTFDGHQDFPAGLMAAAFQQRQIDGTIVRVDAPGPGADSVRLARSFDRLAEPEAYFARIKDLLPDGTKVAVFPAVLGLTRYPAVRASAEAALEIRCLEAPTLPPSVPGLRLQRSFLGRLSRKGVAIHHGAQVVRAAKNGKCINAVHDSGNRVYEAGAFVVATGGVLMGGLDVNSFGRVREPHFGLDVYQTDPLTQAGVDSALDALHQTGVETDQRLRPAPPDTPGYENLFVTGATLAHWHPTREASSEGVAIATGWVAAEEIHAVLEA